MSENNPTPSDSGVWVPMVLANRLFACYYGDGPRHHGRPDSPPPAAVEPSPVVPSAGEPRVDRTVRATGTRFGVPSDISTMRGFTPKGIYTKIAPPVSNPLSPPRPPDGAETGEG